MADCSVQPLFVQENEPASLKALLSYQILDPAPETEYDDIYVIKIFQKPVNQITSMKQLLNF